MRGTSIRIVAAIGQAGELIGYAPNVDFGEGLSRTVEWYRATEPASGALRVTD